MPSYLTSLKEVITRFCKLYVEIKTHSIYLIVLSHQSENSIFLKKPINKWPVQNMSSTNLQSIVDQGLGTTQH